MEGNESCIPISVAIRAGGVDDVTVNFSVKLLFTLFYSTLFFVGLVGNGGVLFAVLQNARLRSARNMFLLNLILTDLLLVVTAVPVTPWYALTKDWQFGSLMCHVMPLSNSCSVFVTSWSLTAIAVDKFLHIIDPTRPPVRIKWAGIWTAVIWLMSFVVNIPYLLSYELVDGSYYVAKNSTPFCGHFCDETNWQGEGSRRLYGTMVMLFQFVIPMGIITYCYSRILNKVSKDMIIQNAQFSQSLSSKQRLDAIHRKRKVNYILIAMVVTFIFCWLPLTLVNLVKDFSAFPFGANSLAETEPHFIKAQPFLWPLIAHVIAMSLVIWNPLLFFWLTRKQKKLRLGKIINTSEVVASFASRISSIRRHSTLSRKDTNKSRRRQITGDSEKDSVAGSKPLIIHADLKQTSSVDADLKDML